jgi:hypothetical protein
MIHTPTESCFSSKNTGAITEGLRQVSLMRMDGPEFNPNVFRRLMPSAKRFLDRPSLSAQTSP